jgi:hypothetical protein
MRDAAARRLRGEAPHQPGRRHRGGGAAEHHQREPGEAAPLQRADDPVAGVVGCEQREAEDRADEPGDGTDDECEQGQREEAAAIVIPHRPAAGSWDRGIHAPSIGMDPTGYLWHEKRLGRLAKAGRKECSLWVPDSHAAHMF